jgi:hypothetical protein
MATTKAGLGSRLRVRTGAALTSLALLGGGVGVVVLASPAQAAACRSDVHWDDFWSAGAEANTELCAISSRSVAKHGSHYADSGWFTGSSYAHADAGVSTNHYAYNQFG